MTRHAVGDRVGVGTIVDSCRECENCRAGVEQYCLSGNTQAYCSVDRDGTITQGGYSTHVVVDEEYVLRIPSTLDFSTVAPSKRDDGLRLGAGAYYATSDPDTIDELANSFDLIDIADINNAWDRVLRSDVRYRFVIDTGSLRGAG